MCTAQNEYHGSLPRLATDVACLFPRHLIMRGQGGDGLRYLSIVLLCNPLIHALGVASFFWKMRNHLEMVKICVGELLEGVSP